MYEDQGTDLANGSNDLSVTEPAASSSKNHDNDDNLLEDSLGPPSVSELDQRLAELTDVELAEVFLTCSMQNQY